MLRNNGELPSYKKVLDYLNSYLLASLRPSKVNIGYRIQNSLQDPTKNEILECFLSLESNNVLNQDLEDYFKIKHIKMTLTIEGILQNTLLPFNAKRDTLLEGSIKFLSDYKLMFKNHTFEEKNIINPFVELKSSLTLIKNKSLYKPTNLENLQTKEIPFYNHEVIYIHTWS